MYKALLVDDEVWMWEGLKKLMAAGETGFIVAAAAKNGRQAWDLLQENHFDLIILDIQMPKMDGLELLKAMRDRHINTPVIIFSGHNEFDYARQAFRYGVIDYLLKPVDKQEFLRLLGKVKETLLKAERSSGNALPEKSPPVAEEETAGGREMIDRLKRKAMMEYQQDLSLSRIAKDANYNLSYMSRLFKSETGTSYLKYLTDIRMQKARQLLRETSLSIGQVAKEVGFRDDKHFIKTFKREVGMTPSEYRGHENGIL
ncbi:MAG: DNA-binding response regulator [Paenibacillus sp.]|nr:DNA-binding response regulator [Paenibacillus sp.]